MVEDTFFKKALRFQTHPNGELVKILYAIDDPWSRTRQRTEHEEKSILAAISEAAAARLGDSRFVWAANKGDLIKHRAFKEELPLPNVPHGLNQYSDIDNVVVLSAMNPIPAEYRFLRSRGITASDVRRAIHFQSVYQAAMRTSIREPDNTNPKVIIVPDRFSAEYLQSLIPGSTTERLETGIPLTVVKKPGRPGKHQDSSERQAEYRLRKNQRDLEALLPMGLLKRPYNEAGQLRNENDKSGNNKDSGDNFDSCYEIPIELYESFVTRNPSQGTIYRGKKALLPGGYIVTSGLEEFIELLTIFHERQLSCKEDNVLISPAIFDPNLSNPKGRTREHIVYLQHLWLDFEDGKLRPEEFSKLFPYVRMVISNSYHHTDAKPRFRVVIPTNRQLTPNEYEFLWDCVALKVRDAGFHVKKSKNAKPHPTRPASGLDHSGRPPTSIFYAPSQAEDPSQSFFIDYNGPEQKILNPDDWPRNTIVLQPPRKETTPEVPSTNIDQDRVLRATEEWWDSRNHPGEGNSRFFDYALELRRAGMSLTEIEAKLHEQASFGRSPVKRRRQIPSIIDSLGTRPRPPMCRPPLMR
jgi:hypothetical protein